MWLKVSSVKAVYLIFGSYNSNYKKRQVYLKSFWVFACTFFQNFKGYKLVESIGFVGPLITHVGSQNHCWNIFTKFLLAWLWKGMELSYKFAESVYWRWPVNFYLSHTLTETLLNSYEFKNLFFLEYFVKNF